MQVVIWRQTSFSVLVVDQLHCMLWLPVILIWVVDRHYYVWIRQIRNSRPKRRCIYRMLLHQVKITIPRSTVFCCASFGLVQGQWRLEGLIFEWMVYYNHIFFNCQNRIMNQYLKFILLSLSNFKRKRIRFWFPCKIW